MMKAAKWIVLTLLGLTALLYLGTMTYYSRQGVFKYEYKPAVRLLTAEQGLNWIPIHWVSTEVSDRGCLYLPVYLDTIRKPFWMQLDLGTPVTDFHDIARYFPYLYQKESVLPDKEADMQDSGKYFSGFHIQIGKLAYTVQRAPVYDKLGLDSLQETDSLYDTKIGSLGYDLIAGHILVIDFAHARLAITDALPDSLEKQITFFDDGKINQFPIFIPIEINGQKKLICYDSGASGFTLWTYPRLWGKWRDKTAPVDTFKGYSWGKPEYYLRAAAAKPIGIMGQALPGAPIWALERENMQPGFLPAIQRFTEDQFGKTFPGSMGNGFFRKDILILDTKRNRYGSLELKD